MRYFKILLIILLFIPVMVFAEESLSISSIEKVSVEGSVEEVSSPIIENENIKLNIKMYDVGDSITYKISIKNNTNDGYFMDIDNMLEENSSYIDYTLSLVGNSNELKSKTSRDLLLKVIYKNTIDKALLDGNNRYDASNTIRIKMDSIEINTNNNSNSQNTIISNENTINTNEKTTISNEIPNNPTITAEKLTNPDTSDSIIPICIVATLLLIAIILLIVNKNKICFVIILSFLLIPTIYAAITWSFNVEVKIEIEYKPTLNETIIGLSKADNACVTKYTGDVTDEVGVTKPASNVYFDKCFEQRNVIFGGFCWQVIRTTETGGTKMVYNGEPVDGKCESTRDEHIGIVGKPINYLNDIEANEVDLSEEYLYGSTFTYDKENATFTLIDSNLATWSDSTYENLISKYTCMNTTGTCTKLYNINAYASNTTAITAEYTIGNTNYAQIGTSPFNGSNRSLSTAGYMFNKAYEYNVKIIYGTTYYKFGSSVTYNDGKYTLTGNTYNLKNIAGNILKDYHYTCWNSTGECTNVAYIYFNYSSEAYYILLSDGKNGSDAVTDMLFSDDVNKNDSSIKGIIDAWYTKELSNYTNYLEDAVYCNSRNIDDAGGWNPDGGVTYKNGLKFKNYGSISNLVSTRILSCSNITDQFSVLNDKAKLKYSVALMQEEERYNLSPKTTLDSPGLDLVKTNAEWWVFSPRSFNEMGLYNNSVDEKGIRSNYSSFYPNGTRPVISLKTTAVISKGTGSEENPWLIKQ